MPDLFINTDFVLTDYVEGDSVSGEDVLEAWLGAAGLWGEPERQAVFSLEVGITKISTGATETLYFADTLYRTKPDHTPANQLFLARLETSDISVSLAESGGLGRRGARSSGVIRLLNNDGRLDAYIDGTYAWEGGTAKLMVGGLTWDYAIFKPIIPKGRIDSIQFTEETIELTVGLTMADFDEPLQDTLYAKTEGSINDSNDAHILDSDDKNIFATYVQDILDDQVVGRRKPLCYGQVKNMEPVLISTDYGAGYLRYQVHDDRISSIETVYEGGLAMEEGTDYVTDLTNGCFNLISTPVATITCAVKGAVVEVGGGPSPPVTWIDDAAGIAKQLLIDHVGLGDQTGIDTDAFTAYSTAHSQIAGFAATGDETRAQALNFLFGPRGWWAPTFEGDKITCGWITEPVGATPDLTLDTRHVASVSRPRTEAPAWRVSLGYGHNFAPVSDLLAGATPAVRKWIQQAWSWSEGAEVAEADRLPQAEDRRFETPWLVEPETEEAALLALYDSRRDIYEMRLARIPEFLWLGDILSAEYDRFEMDSGREFYVIGSRVNPAGRDFRLVVWG